MEDVGVRGRELGGSRGRSSSLELKSKMSISLPFSVRIPVAPLDEIGLVWRLEVVGFG